MSRRFPNIKGTKFPTVHGASVLVNDDAWSILWHAGGAAPTLPSAAGTLSIVSTDAADNTDDLVVVDYLDADWQERRAIFVPDGTTPVTEGTVIGDADPSTISAIRVQRACYYGDAANAGRVDVKIGATTLCSIPIGRRESQTPIYTVPVGQQAVIKGIGYSCSQAVHFRLRKHVEGESGLLTEHEWYAANGGYFPFDYARRSFVQGDDGATWQETKITYVLEAYAPDAGADTNTEASAWLDIEVTRTDTAAPGFKFA